MVDEKKEKKRNMKCFFDVQKVITQHGGMGCKKLCWKLGPAERGGKWWKLRRSVRGVPWCWRGNIPTQFFLIIHQGLHKDVHNHPTYYDVYYLWDKYGRQTNRKELQQRKVHCGGWRLLKITWRYQKHRKDIRKIEKVSYEFDRLIDQNSTLQAAWHIYVVSLKI